MAGIKAPDNSYDILTIHHHDMTGSEKYRQTTTLNTLQLKYN